MKHFYYPHADRSLPREFWVHTERYPIEVEPDRLTREQSAFLLFVLISTVVIVEVISSPTPQFAFPPACVRPVETFCHAMFPPVLEKEAPETCSSPPFADGKPIEMPFVSVGEPDPELEPEPEPAPKPVIQPSPQRTPPNTPTNKQQQPDNPNDNDPSEEMEMSMEEVLEMLDQHHRAKAELLDLLTNKNGPIFEE